MFKDLVLYFTKKELKFRAAGSIGGIFITFIQPFIMFIILTFVFSTILKVKIAIIGRNTSYIIFLLSTFIPWLQFQDTVIKNTSSIIENKDLIKKTVFPIESIIVGNSIATYVIYSLPFIFFCIYCFFKIGLSTFLLIIYLLGIILFQLLFSLGISFFVSAISVYVRDIIQLVPLFFQVWFYATPIVYPVSMIPPSYRKFLKLNPWMWFAECYRHILLINKECSLKNFSILLIISVASFWGGLKFFRLLKNGFADVL